MMNEHAPILTVTPNTAMDRLIEVPGLATGRHLDGRVIARYPAGKGFNVSRALANLACSNLATGWVGSEELATFESFLEAAGNGVSSGQFLPTQGLTRENLTLIDPREHTEIHVRTEGFSVTARDLARLDGKLRALAGPESIVTVCGSRPKGMSVLDLADLLAWLPAAGIRIALDLSGPDLRGLLAVSPESKKKDGPVMVPWLISPNRSEFERMRGVEEGESENARLDAMLELGRRIPWVIVSAAEQGAWLGHDGRIWRACLEVSPDRIRQTVGCGDCLLAGVLSVLSGQDSPESALRRGVACAVANLLAERMADFTMQTVQSLESDVRIDAC
ncbi:MAG: hypothetical protein JJU36_09770 [Phycisphaeraceae bacterium]|nr:hypothetical protein [Phycisphaeraceae bacterium]